MPDKKSAESQDVGALMKRGMDGAAIVLSEGVNSGPPDPELVKFHEAKRAQGALDEALQKIVEIEQKRPISGTDPEWQEFSRNLDIIGRDFHSMSGDLCLKAITRMRSDSEPYQLLWNRFHSDVDALDRAGDKANATRLLAQAVLHGAKGPATTPADTHENKMPASPSGATVGGPVPLNKEKNVTDMRPPDGIISETGAVSKFNIVSAGAGYAENAAVVNDGGLKTPGQPMPGEAVMAAPDPSTINKIELPSDSTSDYAVKKKKEEKKEPNTTPQGPHNVPVNVDRNNASLLFGKYLPEFSGQNIRMATEGMATVLADGQLRQSPWEPLLWGQFNVNIDRLYDQRDENAYENIMVANEMLRRVWSGLPENDPRRSMVANLANSHGAAIGLPGGRNSGSYAVAEIEEKKGMIVEAGQTVVFKSGSFDDAVVKTTPRP